MALTPSSRFLSLLLLACGAASAAPDPVARLAWMQGCWVATDGAEAGSGEHWMAAAGGTVIGSSRTIRNGKTEAWEFLQIREVEPGKLGYIAMPSGRAPTTFALLRESDTEWVFENLAHDFPQRIIYRREGDKLLHARIEGMSKGKLKGIDFPMKRASCEAPST
jgi:hypothetical protein